MTRSVALTQVQSTTSFVSSTRPVEAVSDHRGQTIWDHLARAVGYVATRHQRRHGLAYAQRSRTASGMTTSPIQQELHLFTCAIWAENFPASSQDMQLMGVFVQEAMCVRMAHAHRKLAMLCHVESSRVGQQLCCNKCTGAHKVSFL